MYWLIQKFEIFVIEQTHIQFELGLDMTCNLVSCVDLISGPTLGAPSHKNVKKKPLLDIKAKALPY